MTERLFERDMQLLTFTATVTDCRPAEGGGQPADHGTLGGAAVTDAVRAGPDVVHRTDAPLPVGETVRGVVDGARRRMLSQLHSGEHIFSGLVHRRFGYDNVGFHMGSEAVTMDFNGPMTGEEAREIERAANEIVWSDVPIEVFVPSEEALASIEYRSKKEIDGDVRLVRIPGADCCACCGTHVPTTGAVGQIKLLSVQRYKKGVRVSILCGERALLYETEMLAALRAAAVQLSCREEDAPEAVARLLRERDTLRYEREGLALRLFLAESAAEREKPVRVAVSDALSAGMLHRAAAALAEGARCALALRPAEAGWHFALCAEKEDVRPATRELLSRFGGRGGGPRDMTQGLLSSGGPEDFRAALLAAAGD